MPKPASSLSVFFYIGTNYCHTNNILSSTNNLLYRDTAPNQKIEKEKEKNDLPFSMDFNVTCRGILGVLCCTALLVNYLATTYL